jgi:hypothetical protein
VTSADVRLNRNNLSRAAYKTAVAFASQRLSKLLHIRSLSIFLIVVETREVRGAVN